RNQLFPRWLGRRIRIHRILESNPDSDVQKNLRARLRQTAYPTWAETTKGTERSRKVSDPYAFKIADETTVPKPIIFFNE
ncbi:MAG TPA: hypothetical protein VIJ04_24525, partial [Xanthobacteraceae bacterium]